jgi:hypothetical protein
VSWPDLHHAMRLQTQQEFALKNAAAFSVSVKAKEA